MEPNSRFARFRSDYEREPDEDELDDDVVRHLHPARSRAHAATDERVSGMDLDAALGTLTRAAGLLDMMERALRDAQAQLEVQAEEAMKDLEIAEAKAASLERRALASEARARKLEALLEDAERRALEADDWLARLDSAIGDLLSAQGGSTRRRAAA